jgi:hypothetical protein
MAQTFLEQIETQKITLATRDHPFIKEWKEKNTPKNKLDQLSLFGAVEKKDYEMIARLVPDNPFAEQILFGSNDIGLTAVEIFLLLEVNPFRSGFNIFSRIFDSRIWEDWFELIRQYYGETLPNELLNFVEKEIFTELDFFQQLEFFKAYGTSRIYKYPASFVARAFEQKVIPADRYALFIKITGQRLSDWNQSSTSEVLEMLLKISTPIEKFALELETDIKTARITFQQFSQETKRSIFHSIVMSNN